ncbi:MAG: pyridoxal phosphate-dependent aminotransferase [Euryarchaeota archaeon]|jgi:aspartate/methionine/tyrosine aminotransferase|nr:pyridoxal phosphate-dependent aminotransferase [Euryarchaeota archaeon]
MDEHPLSPNLGGATGGGDFPAIDYLEWYVPRLQAGVDHDLSQSGFHHPWDWQKITGGKLPEHLTTSLTKAPLDPRIWVAEREGIEVSRVAGGHGVSQSLIFALLAVMNPQKPRKVAVEMPSYAPVSQFARALGCDVLPFWRGPTSSTDCGPWSINRQSLESIIDDVAAVITTPMQNPTGWMMTPDDQQWISDICSQHDVGLISDEVYIDSARGTDDYRPMHRYGDHCVSVNSLTKCYGLGPLRVGWIIGSEKTAINASRAFQNLQGSLAVPSLRLAELAWPIIDEPLSLIKTRREKNLPLLLNVLAANGIDWSPPPSGIFGCIPLVGTIDSLQFVEDICTTHGVLAIPGLMFSPKLTQFVRVAWGGEPKEFAAAMEAFNLCLQELK